MIQKHEYLQLQLNASETAQANTEEYGTSNKLGSPSQPEGFFSIDEVEHLCNLPKFQLVMQSWVHNYLQDGIGKSGRRKRVRRSHLPKLSNAYVSNKFVNLHTPKH